MAKKQPEKYLYTVEQAAEYLGIEPRTVRYHYTKGSEAEKKLQPVTADNPHYLNSLIVIFTRDELDRFKGLELKSGRPPKKRA